MLTTFLAVLNKLFWNQNPGLKRSQAGAKLAEGFGLAQDLRKPEVNLKPNRLAFGPGRTWTSLPI